jgi:hypothetical protein
LSKDAKVNIKIYFQYRIILLIYTKLIIFTFCRDINIGKNAVVCKDIDIKGEVNIGKKLVPIQRFTEKQQLTIFFIVPSFFLGKTH